VRAMILTRLAKLVPTARQLVMASAVRGNQAILTGGWPAEIVQQCELEYRRACWPDGMPADFERPLDAARLYLHFLWLGSRPDLAPTGATCGASNTCVVQANDWGSSRDHWRE
jgi:hypothetical protein